MKHKFRRIALILVCLVIVAILWGEAAFRMHRVDVRSEGPNGMWLRHSWVGEEHTKSEYKNLAEKLATMHITEAYFHTGPLQADGSVDPARYRHAADLLSSMKHLAPRVHLYAWLGQVEAKAGGPLDLADARTRSGIIKVSTDLLDLGFDGIHYDIEPIYSGDQAFLSLLKTTHVETARRHKLLSVATSKPEPVRGLGNTARHIAKFPGYWTRPYFLQVAQQCDQVAIMAYDTAIPLPSAYIGLISWVTRWSAENGVKCLLIGIPTYDTTTGSHYPYVENLDNALIGVKQGLSGLPDNAPNRVGVAVYAEWTTSKDEARAYESAWIRGR